MASVQVAGLSSDELALALAYEVEPISGIPAGEAEVTYQALSDENPAVRVFDVTVRRRTSTRGAASGSTRALAAAYAFAALVILALIADALWLGLRDAQLHKLVNERRPLQTQLDRLRDETRKVQASADAIRAGREAAARAQDDAAVKRALHAELLGDLSRACGKGTVLTTIGCDEKAGVLKVRGIDVSGEAAAGMMQALAASVTTNGWQILPRETVESGSGATVSFSFDLQRTR